MEIKTDDFKINEKLYSSKRIKICRGVWLSLKKSVILKFLNNSEPSHEEVSEFRYEYDLTKKAQLPGVIEVYDFVEINEKYCIVFEDFKAEPINRFYLHKRPDLKVFLDHAIQIVTIMRNLHDIGIIHKNINSANLLYNPETDTIKLIDFRIASTLSQEVPEICRPDITEGTLEYIAPEQTGRVSRNIDYRTDFYSVGVTLYELLTGKLPFFAKQQIELIYAQIAKPPVPPHKLNSSIPIPISNIIIKLLHKDASERYQSENCLLQDLKRCHDELTRSGNIADFEIAKEDIPSRFEVRKSLYGREEEVNTILNSYKKLKDNIKVILLSGEAGIGKSSIAYEINNSRYLDGGIFMAGKCDQLQNTQPYYALQNALSSLIHQLLSEKEQLFLSLKEELLKEIGTNAGVLTQLFPELETLLGKQPEPSELPPNESFNRFMLIFQKLFLIIANQEHPIVLLIDDLQWASSALIDLLEVLLNDKSLNHLLVILSYRSDEIEENKLSSRLVADLVDKYEYCDSIVVKSLKVNNINKLVSESLYLDEKNTQELSQLCYQKTGGNPYFIHQFLYSLVKKNIIHFDTKSGSWRWDIEQASLELISENMIAFLQERLVNLSLSAEKLIKLASCIGTYFELSSLSLLYGQPIEETAHVLNELLTNNFVIPLSMSYKYVGEGCNEKIVYKFQHDKLRQAVYESLSSQEKSKTHYDISHIMLDKLDEDGISEKILEIANQYNEGMSHVNDVSEKIKLVDVNIRAGCKAKSILAYELALKYLTNAIDCLPENCFENNYELSLKTYNEAIEAAYLYNDPDLLNKWFEVVDKYAKDPRDLIPAYTNKALALVLSKVPTVAFDSIRPLLIRMGFRYPKKIHWTDVLKQYLRVRLLLVGKSIAKIRNMKEIENKDIYYIQKILCRITTSAYLSNSTYLLYITFLLLKLSLSYGLSGNSAYAFTGYALLLHGLNKIDKAYKYSELAVSLTEYCENVTDKYPVLYVFYCHLGTSRHTYEYVFNQAKHLKEDAYQNGSIDFAAWLSVFMSHIITDFTSNIKKAEKVIIENIDFVKSINNKNAVVYASIAHPFIKNLMQPCDDPVLLNSDYFNENEIGINNDLAQDVWAKKLLYYSKMKIAVILKKLDVAEKFAKKLENQLTITSDVNIHFNFYYAIILLRNNREKPFFKKVLIIKKIRSHLKKLVKWAASCPKNHLHRYHLVLAELYSFLNLNRLATSHYNKSLKLVVSSHLVYDRALVYEFMADFFHRINDRNNSRYYYAKAYSTYLDWGAFTKTDQLMTDHADEILDIIDLAKSIKVVPVKNTQTEGDEESANYYQPNVSSQFDLYPFVSASQAITREIILENLINRMISIVTTYSGAQKVCLIIYQGEHEYLVSISDINHDGIVTNLINDSVDSLDIRYREKVPLTIINYISHTLEGLLIENDVQLQSFTEDTYIKLTMPKSLYAQPLINQGKLVGVLYLENSSTAGIFSDRIIDTIKLLSSQMALSLENAQLYNKLVTTNKSYERFVPKDFLNLLEKEDITSVEIGDQIELFMPIMFIDIRNFTLISEKLSNEELSVILNIVFGIINKVVKENNGFVNKYIGDAILILFPDHPDDAIKCAIAIQTELREFNHARSSKNDMIDINVGIGINYGRLLLCTVGDKDRMDGTVISDVVNLSARVQALTRFYDTPVLITDKVLNVLANPRVYATRNIDKLIVKGKTEPTQILEIIDALSQSRADTILNVLEQYQRGWTNYIEGRFKEANQLFCEVSKIAVNDVPTEILIKRCQHYIDKGYPKNWDGVFHK